MSLFRCQSIELARLSLLPLLFLLVSGEDKCCGPGDDCWPTTEAWNELENSISDADRSYAFPPIGTKEAPFSSWPVLTSMQKIYHRPINQTVCYEELNFDVQTDFCKVSTVNKPEANVTPAVVVWPASTSDVQKIIHFVGENKLCLCIAGPGNSESSRGLSDRNNCVLLRTGILRTISWALSDVGGSVHLGAGLRFTEVYTAGETQKRLIIGGNCPQVGVVGWLLGGGHSAYSPAYGLGVDNVLKIEMVSANGSVVTIRDSGTSLSDFGSNQSRTSDNIDLWWALRGGGGGTWGVVTAVTYKAHLVPEVKEIIVHAVFPWLGETDMKLKLALYYDISKLMGDKFSMYAAWVTVHLPIPAVSFIANIKYFGHVDDPVYKQVLDLFNGLKGNITEATAENRHRLKDHFESAYGSRGSDAPIVVSLDPTTPELFSQQGSAAVTGMVDIRTEKGSFTTAVAKCIGESMRQGISIQVLMFNTWTGLAGEQAVGPEASTPLAYGTRNGIFEIGIKVPAQEGVDNEKNKDFTTNVLQPLLNNALPSVYFSETQFNLPEWKTRYWGSHATVERLEKIKAEWDPESLFGCRNCIGNLRDGVLPNPNMAPPLLP